MSQRPEISCSSTGGSSTDDGAYRQRHSNSKAPESGSVSSYVRTIVQDRPGDALGKLLVSEMTDEVRATRN